MMNDKPVYCLTELPLFKKIAGKKSILLAGAGGGFDVFSGIPLYFALKERGASVYLANISFSHLDTTSGNRLTPHLLEVTAESHGITSDGRFAPTETYFPELYLSQWFKQKRQADVSVFCFKRAGVQPLLEAYRALIAHLSLDCIILVDGGTDSLMRGDESGLGTPVEDSASIAAVNELQEIDTKLLVCLGFGIDAHHGVCHSHFLQNTAILAGKGGFLGAFSILEEMEEVRLFKEACLFVFKKMEGAESIVCASIISAVEGKFGNHHMLERTKSDPDSKLFINPLMSMYWAYDATHVANELLYLNSIKDSQEMSDIVKAIEAFRLELGTNIRKEEKLPF